MLLCLLMNTKNNITVLRGFKFRFKIVAKRKNNSICFSNGLNDLCSFRQSTMLCLNHDRDLSSTSNKLFLLVMLAVWLSRLQKKTAGSVQCFGWDWNIPWKIIEWTGAEICTDIQAQQRVNKNDLDDSLTFHLASPALGLHLYSVQRIGF